MKKNTIEDFVTRANEVHNRKYDYSKVVYVNNKTTVVITCPKHGDFVQRPDRHIYGNGCPICGLERKKSLIRGVAINDTLISKRHPALKCWLEMLRRCYPKTEREKSIHRNYSDCKVCDNWLKFSNFYEWFLKNWREGYNLDKDLFSNGKEKIYSPETCCFLPKEINIALQYEHIRMRKDGCQRFYNKGHKYFESKLNIKGKTVGIGRFDNEADAIKAYVSKKTEYLKQLANEYFSKGLISINIFNKLNQFKVNYANY